MDSQRINFHGLREDPGLWEHLVERENEAGETDAHARTIVESMYWEKDRAAAFHRFFDGLDFAQIQDLLTVFGISRSLPICEIGGGSGQLAWSLARSGFEYVELLEPNPFYITGTGWLRTQIEGLGGALRICTSLPDWCDDEKLFPAIITRNCVHHFPNIAMAAAAIRQKVDGVYEFPFPSRHYIACLQYAGFALKAVVPLGWGNNALSSYRLDAGSPRNRVWEQSLALGVPSAPLCTVGLYFFEDWCNRVLGTRIRRFTRPQMMVFRRRE
ncbi:MAG: hypothetical protein U1E56_00320 [Bauldia sp.]